MLFGPDFASGTVAKSIVKFTPGTSVIVENPASESVTVPPYRLAHQRACVAWSPLSIASPCNVSAGESGRRNAQNSPPSGSASTVHRRSSPSNRTMRQPSVSSGPSAGAYMSRCTRRLTGLTWATWFTQMMQRPPASYSPPSPLASGCQDSPRISAQNGPAVSGWAASRQIFLNRATAMPLTLVAVLPLDRPLVPVVADLGRPRRLDPIPRLDVEQRMTIEMQDLEQPVHGCARGLDCDWRLPPLDPAPSSLHKWLERRCVAERHAGQVDMQSCGLLVNQRQGVGDIGDGGDIELAKRDQPRFGQIQMQRVSAGAIGRALFERHGSITVS